ncbi:MAG: response regulator transcription factor [Hyphomicrobiales bacterium]|nr:response regulator transcription factor [Hyphomicrobiales bacterium]
MHGEKYDFDLRVVLPQYRQRVDTSQLRHRNVRDDHVRLQFFRGGDQSHAVLHRAHQIEIVLMVADEVSLFEGAERLQNELAVVDLGLSRGAGVDLVRRIRERFPAMKLIIVSSHDHARVSCSALAAGADGFVVKHAIATACSRRPMPSSPGADTCRPT